VLVFSGWQSQHAMSIKSLAPAHSKPAGAFSFGVGVGRRSHPWPLAVGELEGSFLGSYSRVVASVTTAN
jgi:hypothetical protein